MTLDAETTIKAGGALAAIAAAWGAARVSILSVTARVTKAEARQDAHEAVDVKVHAEMIDRLARIETKIDFFMGEKR